MNKQLATLLATITLLVSSSGCSGMKNFLFGRGAGCSTCATAAPIYSAPPMAEPGCGFEPSCGFEPTCGFEPAHVAPRSGCGLFGGRGTCNGSPGCNCNSGVTSYMPSNVEPYETEVHDPYAHGGEVIGSQVMGDSYGGYPTGSSVINGSMSPNVSYPSNSMQDNFDSRGDRIISAQPIPGMVTQP